MKKRKKILVVFYSRTGNTGKIGKKIAKILKADIDEIIDLKKRKGIVGWVISGKDSMQKEFTKINYNKDISNYDLVVIGTPIWAWTITPAVRTYLKNNKGKFGKVAFFCTCGGNKGKSFQEMENIAGKPICTLELRDKDLENIKEIKDFCIKLR